MDTAILLPDLDTRESFLEKKRNLERGTAKTGSQLLRCFHNKKKGEKFVWRRYGIRVFSISSRRFPE
jgi:hypothetical protein